MNNLLQSARQIALFVPTTPCSTTTFSKKVCTDNLEAAIAVTTHHDGITGTEKQAVADDYELRLAIAETETRNMLVEALTRTVGLPDLTFCYGTLTLNISFCPYTSNHNAFTVVAYNGLGHTVNQTLRIPISSGTASVMCLSTGKAVLSQTVPLSQRELSLPMYYLQYPEKSDPKRVANFTNNATHVLVFTATLPPVGYQTYAIKVGGGEAVHTLSTAFHSINQHKETEPMATITNDYYKVTLDRSTGTISQVTNLKTGVSTNLGLEVGFYKSSLGGCTRINETSAFGADDSNLNPSRRREAYEFGMDDPVPIDKSGFICGIQPSGAYIFRPNNSHVYPAACTMNGDCNKVPTFNITIGPLLQEATILFLTGLL